MVTIPEIRTATLANPQLAELAAQAVGGKYAVTPNGNDIIYFSSIPGSGFNYGIYLKPSVPTFKKYTMPRQMISKLIGKTLSDLRKGKLENPPYLDDIVNLMLLNSKSSFKSKLVEITRQSIEKELEKLLNQGFFSNFSFERSSDIKQKFDSVDTNRLFSSIYKKDYSYLSALVNDYITSVFPDISRSIIKGIISMLLEKVDKLYDKESDNYVEILLGLKKRGIISDDQYMVMSESDRSIEDVKSSLATYLKNYLQEASLDDIVGYISRVLNEKIDLPDNIEEMFKEKVGEAAIQGVIKADPTMIEGTIKDFLSGVPGDNGYLLSFLKQKMAEDNTGRFTSGVANVENEYFMDEAGNFVAIIPTDEVQEYLQDSITRIKRFIDRGELGPMAVEESEALPVEETNAIEKNVTPKRIKKKYF